MKIVSRLNPLITLLVILPPLIGYGDDGENRSIYKTEDNKIKIMTMYEGKLSQWPVANEIMEIRTKYGSTNIVASGSDTAPPVILIHAMGVTSTMWVSNIEALSMAYRVYAIDVIGASMGGWIALNYAINSPDKVKRLVLLGPMGLKANTFKVVSKLTKILINPSQKNKAELTRWVLGDDTEVNDALGEYMNTAMNCEGRLGVPRRIGKSELKRIEASTLLILGGADNPIGNPIKNKKYAEGSISALSVEILPNTGHLMNVESPEEINNIILEFLSGGG